MVRVILFLLLLLPCWCHSVEEKKHLLLEVKLEGNYPLYPGERAKVVYRIYYKGKIKLTKEKLPLLQAKGFRKIGSLEVKEGSSQDYSISIISQEIQAIEPGTFVFPPSVVEGEVATFITGQGEPSFIKAHAEVPSLKLEVTSFPEKEKPSSFKGALGKFIMKTEMLTPSQVEIGDEVKLKVTITGAGEMDTVTLPDIQCQPGFSGFFYTSGVPLEEPSVSGSKVYYVKMRPLSSDVWQVPSLEFSSFVISTKSYHIARSQAIPLTAREVKAKNPPDTKDVHTDWKEEWSHLSAASIAQNIPLSSVGQDKAYQNYLLGLKATTIVQRRFYFNQALALYQQIEKTTDSSALFFNLGNSFFQLGKYAWAIYYYERARALTPCDQAVARNLMLAQEKLQLPHASKGSRAYLSFFSLNESLQVLFVFSLFSLGFLSFFYRYRHQILRILTILSIAGAFLFLSHVVYLQYFTSLKAIIVQAAPIYRGSNSSAPLVRPLPLLPGTKVEVMEVVQKGRWLKVVTNEGYVGYVLDEYIRVI